jgi:hypothetical protein
MSQYPDVDPTGDVDYIGDAVSISRPMDQAAVSNSESAPAKSSELAAN